MEAAGYRRPQQQDPARHTTQQGASDLCADSHRPERAACCSPRRPQDRINSPQGVCRLAHRPPAGTDARTQDRSPVAPLATPAQSSPASPAGGNTLGRLHPAARWWQRWHRHRCVAPLPHGRPGLHQPKGRVLYTIRAGRPLASGPPGGGRQPPAVTPQQA